MKVPSKPPQLDWSDISQIQKAFSLLPLLDMERKGLLRSSKIRKKLVFEGTDLLSAKAKAKLTRASV